MSYTIGLKTLTTTVLTLPLPHRDILSKHFNRLWEQYWQESEYWRVLKDNKKITLTEYRKQVIPKLREVRNELQLVAKLLK